MPVEMRMWRIDGDVPHPLSPTALPAEKDLHQFLAQDPSLLGTRLLVIGSEVITPYGKRLDLLAVDAEGNLHVLELKRDKTPREVVAQVLDYASWVTNLSRESVIEIANAHLSQPFEAAFADVFNDAPPDDINEGDLSLVIVASELDPSSERIVSYLRTFGVPINAVFFTYLEDEGRRYLARSWFADADETVEVAAAKVSKSKSAPWNGRDWYVSFGGDRPWEDALQFNFISAGGGKFYSQTMRGLPVGARVWVNVPGTGYVAVGVTVAPAQRFTEASVLIDGAWVRLAEQQVKGRYRHQNADDDHHAEWVVPVRWLDARPAEKAYWKKGMFASEHSACRLRQQFTLDLLAKHFSIEGDGDE